ncbi:hypothetical protein CROQUDRAFT_304672 [Cronartium quercuum f. sp. fusiforme G11]|uniref:Uncharacterized protein n=1 Tax=Cronartium quercuum f. sp. fusiforme G11 TaxID=708437 RepID=A0A9P6N7Q1_9BASI|nr:hypothetical protein CROQUDRAFT_304672 [Cronartium quercuum f. sp. fusiforme G11]
MDHLQTFGACPASTSTSTPTAHPLTFDHKISISLRTPAYHRHDFLIASLVCVSHEDDQDEEFGGTEDWFLGAFGSWWALDRRHASEWLKSIWRHWNHEDMKPLEDDHEVHGQNRPAFVLSTPSISDPQKPKSSSSKKKKHGRGRKKSPGCELESSTATIPRPSSCARAKPLTLEPSDPDSLSSDSFSTGSELDSLSSEVPKPLPRPPWESDEKEKDHPSELAQLTTPSHRVTYSCETTSFLRLDGVGEEEAKGRKPKKICAESVLRAKTRTTRRTTVEISHPPPEALMLSAEVNTTSESTGSNGGEERGPSELEAELNKELNEIKFKKNEEDLNKLHFKSSLKHLNEIKELKEFKRLNLNEKLGAAKLSHNNLVLKAQALRNELVGMDVKESATQFRFGQELEQAKQEEVRAGSELEKNELEYDASMKTFEAKKAQKAVLVERLNARKLELRVKRETSKRPSSSSSKKTPITAHVSEDQNSPLEPKVIASPGPDRSSSTPLPPSVTLIKKDALTGEASERLNNALTPHRARLIHGSLFYNQIRGKSQARPRKTVLPGL